MLRVIVLSVLFCLTVKCQDIDKSFCDPDKLSKRFEFKLWNIWSDQKEISMNSLKV